MDKQPTLQNWRTFKQQLTLYLAATGVPDESQARKKVILLTLGGAKLLHIYNIFGLADDHEEALDLILKRYDEQFQQRANDMLIEQVN